MRWSPKGFCRPGRLLILTVLLTAAGYFIFSGAFREPAEPRPVLQPERSLTMSFSVSRLSAGLIPGRYRALLYGTSWEFTVP